MTTSNRNTDAVAVKTGEVVASGTPVDGDSAAGVGRTTASDPTATPQQTLEALTRYAGRGFTPVRNSFVQRRLRSGKFVGSSLGQLVHERRHRALLGYLLLLMTTQSLDRRSAPLEAKVWARALSPRPPAPAWPDTAMTPIWAMLDTGPPRLITKERQARLVKITPRKENGRGDYTRPRPDQQPGDAGELYFTLPDAFWLDDWHNMLSLPGVAVLLILLAGTVTRDEAWLSPERAPEWYGIAPKTMYNGLEDLRKNGLLAARDEWVTAALSGIGKTKKTHYRLRDPFSRAARLKLQDTTRTEAQRRAAAATPPPPGRFPADCWSAGRPGSRPPPPPVPRHRAGAAPRPAPR